MGLGVCERAGELISAVGLNCLFFFLRDLGRIYLMARAAHRFGTACTVVDMAHITITQLKYYPKSPKGLGADSNLGTLNLICRSDTHQSNLICRSLRALGCSAHPSEYMSHVRGPLLHHFKFYCRLPHLQLAKSTNLATKEHFMNSSRLYIKPSLL